jgi:hypothetical protein
MMSFICSWQFQKSTGLSGKTGHSKLTYVNELWSGDNHVTCCSIRNHQEIRSLGKGNVKKIILFIQLTNVFL